MQSNGQEFFCDAVKWSSSKNDGQDFLTPVTALHDYGEWECHPLEVPCKRVTNCGGRGEGGGGGGGGAAVCRVPGIGTRSVHMWYN